MTARGPAGFTLLEVLVSLAVLAIAAAAIAGAHNASGVGSIRSHRMMIASQLMRGVVLDIEEEYQVDGFPENNKEAVDCDVPDPWDDVFDCEYDLEGLETDDEVLSSLAESGMAGMLGGLGGQGPPNLETLQNSGLDTSKMLALAPLFGPEGDQIVSTCGVNIAQIITSLMSVGQFFPEIVRQAARQTRKLKVRLSYEFRPGQRREMLLETFIIAIPREALERAERLEQVLDSGLIPTPSGTDPAGGTP